MLAITVREFDSYVLPNGTASSVFENSSVLFRQFPESALYKTLNPSRIIKSGCGSSGFADAGTVLDTLFPVWFSETGTSEIVPSVREARNSVPLPGHLPPKARYKIRLTIRNVKKGQPNRLDDVDLF
jgi:hypothetical protein